jgi:uncharacterized protein
MSYLSRYVRPAIVEDLQRKMVFLAGPRQSGKTTFAKKLLKETQDQAESRYMNWDVSQDRENILKERFPAGEGMLVLDEIHKYSGWRQTVKGLYDKRGDNLQILVTGSARLDYYRHGGDSLQGRYHFHRLHPLSFAEIEGNTQQDLMDLLTYGGFPEPFFLGSEKQTKRWSRDYRARLLQEDLRDLEKVKDIALVERLSLRLPELVGSPLSINGLREDLLVAHQTVARWVQILENLYMIFRIRPFGRPQIRAVKKEAKHYHLDWTQILDPGARFENLVACHLQKFCHFQQDVDGRNLELLYFRDIDHREVDFVLVEDGQPLEFIECKISGRRSESHLRYLKKRFPKAKASLISLQGTEELIDKNSIFHLPAHKFLSTLI